jgi:hypothetical protein
MADNYSGKPKPRTEEEMAEQARRLIEDANAPGIIEVRAGESFDPNCCDSLGLGFYRGYDPGRIASQLAELGKKKKRE